uniref:Uncharacterized protein n=1 Tax=Opuntia streptacantha TaxID=393608 RepID=A0A7C9CLY7_OPUST
MTVEERRVAANTKALIQLWRQLLPDQPELGVPFNHIPQLVLELNHHLSNIAFHHLTDHLLRIQVTEIHHLGTGIPLIEVPFLNTVPNLLQHPRTQPLLFPHHLQHLLIDAMWQQAWLGVLNPPLVIPLLSPHILHHLLVCHISVHLNRLCLGQQSHIDTP